MNRMDLRSEQSGLAAGASPGIAWPVGARQSIMDVQKKEAETVSASGSSSSMAKTRLGYRGWVPTL